MLRKWRRKRGKLFVTVSKYGHILLSRELTRICNKWGNWIDIYYDDNHKVLLLKFHNVRNEDSFKATYRKDGGLRTFAKGIEQKFRGRSKHVEVHEDRQEIYATFE